MSQQRGENLFVYGTLMEDANVRSLTGRMFVKEQAILWNYERIVPNRGYPYIVAKDGASVSGVVLKDVDRDSMFRLDQYESEGDLYDRVKVELEVKDGGADAYVYVGRPDTLKAHYGEDIEADERVKGYLEKQTQEMISARDGEEPETPHALARRELRSVALVELIENHLRNGPPSDFAIRYALDESPLPTLGNIRNDRDAAPYADNYVRLAVMHMIFNQVEDRVHERLTSNIKVADSYYEHTISNLAALAYVNAVRRDIDSRLRSERLDVLRSDAEYIDYSIGAVQIVDEIYDEEQAEDLVQWIRSHRNPGRTPLGAEIEMSNVGVRAVDADRNEDPQYDSFYYFHDFDLMARSWKLGGYLDNHQDEYIEGERSRGFFEYAFGRYKIIGDLSKPATDDPWILNELIQQALEFTQIRPHSLHLSFQPPEPIQTERPTPPEDLICFLLLGGDLGPDRDGRLRERRFFSGELVHQRFSRINSHTPIREDYEDYYYQTTAENEVEVIEYQFPRLKADRNYQPLIMALKGYQIARNPRPVNRDIPNSELDVLAEWAENPQALPAAVLEDFVKTVGEGLRKEDAHSDQFIEEMLALITRDLRTANTLVGAKRK